MLSSIDLRECTARGSIETMLVRLIAIETGTKELAGCAYGSFGAGMVVLDVPMSVRDCAPPGYIDGRVDYQPHKAINTMHCIHGMSQANSRLL